MASRRQSTTLTPQRALFSTHHERKKYNIHENVRMNFPSIPENKKKRAMNFLRPRHVLHTNAQNYYCWVVMGGIKCLCHDLEMPI